MSDFIYNDDEQDHRGWRADPFEGQPIDVPLGDITDAPRQCVEISLDWVPVIISALERLKFGDMWLGTEADVERAANNIDTLQVMLADGQCDGGNMDYTCYDIPLHSPIINWLPADPFENDPPLPHGYTMAPWKISPFDDPVNGIQAGDVIVNPITALTSFPPIIPTSGVPRVQITVTGPAEIDIEFARVFQGGIALILVDGVPRHYVDCQLFNVADILNVTSWLELFGFAVGTFTRAPLEMPIELPDAQEYVIEIQMFPRPALDYSLGYGGGIRGISICSEQEQIDMSPFVTDIRINDGTVEKQVDSVWSAVGQEDSDDVLTESDLRGNGCQLEFYDLATSSWIKVPGSDYLNVLDTCQIQDNVEINTDVIPQLRLFHQPTQKRIDIYHAGTTGVFGASDAFQIGILGGGLTVYMSPAGQFIVRQAPTPSFTKGFFNLSNTDTRDVLNVKANNAAVSRLLALYNSDDELVVEAAQNGWFSALQQLIINDMSSTSVKRAQGRLLGQWADDTDATRKGRTILQADDFAGVREGLRVEADGAAALLGFFGSAAVALPTVIGDTPSSAITNLLQKLDDLGLIDNQALVDADTPGVGMETRYEVYWDAKDHSLANDFTLVTGNWYTTVGYQHAIFLGESVVHLTRNATDGQQIYDWRILVHVENLTAGVVTVLVVDTGAPNKTLYINTIGDGDHDLIIPIERSFWANNLSLQLYTDQDETALIIVSDIWERGMGMPTSDENKWETDLKIHSDITAEWYWDADT